MFWILWDSIACAVVGNTDSFALNGIYRERCAGYALAGRKKLAKQAEKDQSECRSVIFTSVLVWDLVLLVMCLFNEAQAKNFT